MRDKTCTRLSIKLVKVIDSSGTRRALARESSVLIRKFACKLVGSDAGGRANRIIGHF